jgi:hypothetical protein
VRYLQRHPAELDLTLDQMADIAYVAREIEKAEAENASAILKALMGSRF